MTDLILAIGRKRYPVADIEAASRIYQELRDQSGLGASRWPSGKLSNGFTISYNGRVWKGDQLVCEAAAYEWRARQ